MKDLQTISKDLEHVPFHDDVIFIVDHHGEPFVPVRPICENMGLDWKTQYRKLMEKKERLSVVIMTTQLPDDQQRREMVCISLKKLFAWLLSIEPNKVAPHLKETVEVYQQECDEVLWNYWTKGVAVNDKRLKEVVVVTKDDYIQLLENKVTMLELQKPRKNRPSRPFTQEDAREIIRLRQSGLTYREISDRVDRSSATISFTLRGVGDTEAEQLLPADDKYDAEVRS